MFLEEKKIGEADTKPVEPWRQYLLDAADYIEEHGWVQKAMCWAGRVCTLGAFEKVTPSDNEYFYLINQFARNCGIPYLNIAGWNDASGQTKEKVVAELRRVARS